MLWWFVGVMVWWYMCVMLWRVPFKQSQQALKTCERRTIKVKSAKRKKWLPACQKNRHSVAGEGNRVRADGVYLSLPLCCVVVLHMVRTCASFQRTCARTKRVYRDVRTAYNYNRDVRAAFKCNRDVRLAYR
jgi:hypothetical protein